MKLIIDCRETDLIQEMNKQKLKNKNFSNIEFSVKNLDIGDIIIEKDDIPYIIIERKTVSDLASSIQDGRYKEQGMRLNSSNLHNHSIYYLIEGNVIGYNSKFSKISNYTLLSSIISISHTKGFSTYRSSSLIESSVWILQMFHKLSKPDTESFYSNEKKEDYIDCVKIKKNNNITKENISILMLSQIPKVSIQTSKIIFDTYKTMDNLIQSLKDDPNCLNELYSMNSGKKRKINKSSISNILEFLL